MDFRLSNAQLIPALREKRKVPDSSAEVDEGSSRFRARLRHEACSGPHDYVPTGQELVVHPDFTHTLPPAPSDAVQRMPDSLRLHSLLLPIGISPAVQQALLRCSPGMAEHQSQDAMCTAMNNDLDHNQGAIIPYRNANFRGAFEDAHPAATTAALVNTAPSATGTAQSGAGQMFATSESAPPLQAHVSGFKRTRDDTAPGYDSNDSHDAEFMDLDDSGFWCQVDVNSQLEPPVKRPAVLAPKGTLYHADGA